MTTVNVMADTERRPERSDVPVRLAPPENADIIAAARPADLVEPFHDDQAGFDYFGTDYHLRYVARTICAQLARKRGFVLVTGEPLPDGELVARFLCDEPGYRATMVRCYEGGGFNELIRSYGLKLGVESEDNRASLWALLSLLMVDSRNGLTGVLVVEHAELLDTTSLDELCRFAKLDDPHLLSVVLLAAPSITERLREPSLEFLRAAMVASIRHQQLEPAEVGAFIQFQLNRTRSGTHEALSPDVINTIAELSEGDPIKVNRLARQAVTEHEASDRVAEAPPLPPAPEPMPVALPPSLPPALPEADGAVSVSTEAKVSTLSETVPAPAPQPERRQRGRFFSGAVAAAYVAAVVLSGLGLLYLFRPAHRPEAALPIIMASLPQPPAPAAAPPPVDTEPPPPPPVAAMAPAPAEPAPPAPAENVAVQPVDAPVAAPSPPQAETSVASEQQDAVGSADHAGVSSVPDAPVTVAETPPAAAPEPPQAAPAAPPAPAAAAEEPAPTPATAAAVAAIEPSAPSPDTAQREPANPIVPPAPLAQSGEALSLDELAVLLRRGDQLLAAGDIVSARRFFERAAEAGDAIGAVGLGKSYDPLFLRQLRARGIAGDRQKAMLWYRQAAAAGNIEAAQRLNRLLAASAR